MLFAYHELSIYVNIHLNIHFSDVCIDETTVQKFQLNVDDTVMYYIVLLIHCEPKKNTPKCCCHIFHKTQ